MCIHCTLWLLLKDVNECTDFNGECHQVCINTDGGFYCSCNEGYELQYDNITCQGLLSEYQKCIIPLLDAHSASE